MKMQANQILEITLNRKRLCKNKNKLSGNPNSNYAKLKQRMEQEWQRPKSN